MDEKQTRLADAVYGDVENLPWPDALVERTATLLGLGWTRYLPATTAAMVGFVLYKLVAPTFGEFILAGLYWSLLSWFIGSQYERLCGVPDSKTIVIDEFAGGWIATGLAPQDIRLQILSVVIFRAMDIIKTSPVIDIEMRFSSGLAIMLDDIVAAIIASGIVHLIDILFWGA